jgi:photosystem II stability/assembly factor-like uncharacterized protein
VTCLFHTLISGPGQKISSGSALFLQEQFARNRVLRVLLLGLILLVVPGIPLSAQNWQRLGPPGGNVISIGAAGDGTVYLGTPDGHVFASTDRGDHWELRGRVSGRMDGVVQKIVADPAQNDRLLTAVWFQDPAQGGGVFESLDGARHWTLIGLNGEAVRALEHSESDPHVWVAGTRSGVYLSLYDARSWRRITPSNDPELQNVDSLAIDPGNSQIIYVGTYHLPWKTTNGGKTWHSIASGMIDDSDIMSLRIDTKNPRRIFSSACSGIYRSDDAGASWTKLQGVPYASRRTQQIVQDPNAPGTLYAATTEGLWQTSDYGENWKRVTSRENVANTVLLLPAAHSSRVLAGMQAQGVLRSDDGANSFSTSNAGFSHRVITSVAADPRDARHLLARLGEYSGKLFETQDAGTSWTEFPATLPAKPWVNLYGSSSGWWLSLSNGGLVRFDPSKRAWQAVTFREKKSRKQLTPNTARLDIAARSVGTLRALFPPHVISLLESGEKLIVATDDGLWVGKRSETEFRRLTAKNLPHAVSYISVGAQNSLLAISEQSLWTSDPSFVEWNTISTPEGAGRLLWVRDLSPDGSQARLLGTQNGVFLSLPGGRWRLLADGIPAISSLPVGISDSNWLIAMMNGGVYESRDCGNTWQRLDSDAEHGKLTSVLPVPQGLVVASQSEGFLGFSR